MTPDEQEELDNYELQILFNGLIKRNTDLRSYVRIKSLSFEQLYKEVINLARIIEPDLVDTEKCKYGWKPAVELIKKRLNRRVKEPCPLHDLRPQCTCED